MTRRFSDEDLMAFADGEADPALAGEIRSAAEKDRKLAERIALFKGTAAMAKNAFDQMAKWQPPQDLVDKIRNATAPTENVVAFKPRAAKPSFFMPTTIAASLALAVGIGLGAFLGGQPGNGPAGSVALGPLGNAEVATALSTLRSGEQRNLEAGRIEMVATFMDDSNRLCREFELDAPSQQTFVTVTCQTGNRWDVVFSAAAPATPEGFAPAGSRDAVDAYLQSIGASDTLSVEEEAKRLGL